MVGIGEKNIYINHKYIYNDDLCIGYVKHTHKKWKNIFIELRDIESMQKFYIISIDVGDIHDI